MPKGFFVKIALFIAFINSAFGYDFSHCITYYDEASSVAGNSRSISLKTSEGNLALIFSPTPPSNLKIFKADAFVGLYIVQNKKTPYSYDFLSIDSYAKSNELSAIGFNYRKKGKILKSQRGFVEYGEFSSPIPRNGVISNICYQIYGLGVGSKYFIDKRYLDRFLNEKSAYYGDIGVRVLQKDSYIIVYQVDPFFDKNPFRVGDVILSINGKNITSYQNFEWIVSNLAYKKPAEIEFIRNGQKQKLNVIVDKRYGGFLLPDTFLERFGISLDKTLTITDIDENSKNTLGFKVGDRLVWISQKPILKDSDDSKTKANNSLRNALSEARMSGDIEVLVMRNGLEFRLKL